MTYLPNPAKAVRMEVAVDKTQPSRVLWLEYGMMALRAIELHFGVSATDLQSRMSGGGFGDALAVFHAGLVKHQPNYTMEDAADVMDELGQAEAKNHMAKAFSLAFPTAALSDAAAGAGEAGADPQTGPANRAARRASAATSRKSKDA